MYVVRISILYSSCCSSISCMATTVFGFQAVQETIEMFLAVKMLALCLLSRMSHTEYYSYFHSILTRSQEFASIMLAILYQQPPSDTTCCQGIIPPLRSSILIASIPAVAIAPVLIFSAAQGSLALLLNKGVSPSLSLLSSPFIFLFLTRPLPLR